MSCMWNDRVSTHGFSFHRGGGIRWDVILFKLRKSMTNKVLPKMYVILITYI